MTWLIVLGVALCIGFVLWSIVYVGSTELPNEPWCECDEHDYGKLELQVERRFLICKDCGHILDREAENERYVQNETNI